MGSGCIAWVVHVTGLQTRMGMQVWVRRVWVWVVFEVPIQNPHLCNRYGRFFFWSSTGKSKFKLSSNSNDWLVLTIIIDASTTQLNACWYYPQHPVYPSVVPPISFFSFVACFYQLINCFSFLLRISQMMNNEQNRVWKGNNGDGWGKALCNAVPVCPTLVCLLHHVNGPHKPC